MIKSDTTLHETWCKRRDADAFTELVCRHSSMVFSACMRVLGNEGAAEEVAQECFVELMKTSKPVTSSVAGWLHTVATRRSVDRLRSDISRNLRENRYADQTTQTSEPTWDDVSGYIDQAIAGLSEELRIPMVLRFLGGKSHKEIARELDVSLSTVKRRLDKGIARIREELSNKGIVISAAILVGMLHAAPVFALPTALAAQLGKLTLAGNWAAKTGASGAAALKSAGTIGGIIAMKKTAIIAVVVGLSGLAFIQLNPPTEDEDVVEVAQEGVAPPPKVPESDLVEAPVVEPESEKPAAQPATSGAEPKVAGRVLDPNEIPIEGGTVVLRSRRIGGQLVEIVPRGDDLVVAGRVVDESGEPVKGVFVQLVAVDTPLPVDEYTDEEGRFRLVRIPEGRYWIATAHPGYEHTLEIVEAGDQNVEIMIASMERLDLSGHVVAAETGEPITKFDVQVREGVVRELHDSGFGGFMPFEDDNGSFLWPKVARGNATVIARAPGREMRYEYVDLTQGSLGEVLIRLERSGIARGVVASASGEPVPEAYLILSAFPHHLNVRFLGNLVNWFERNAVARSSSDGAFVIDSLIPELRVITAFHLEHGFGSIAVDKNSVTNRQLKIIVRQGGIIEGTVSVGGLPVRHADVRITTRGMPGELLGLTTTGVHGAYRLGRVPEGRWSVAAKLRPAVSSVPPIDGRRIVIEVDVSDGQTTPLDIDFPAPRSSLEGIVLVEDQPATFGSVFINVDAPEGPESNATNIETDGSYRFDELPAGEAFLAVQAGLEPSVKRSASQRLTLEEDKVHTIDFNISGGSTLQGSLLGLVPEENHVLITAYEGVLDSSGGDAWLRRALVRAQTLALADGTYTMEGLAPGVYTLKVLATVLDSRNVGIRSRSVEVLVEIDAGDGDVVYQDIRL